MLIYLLFSPKGHPKNNDNQFQTVFSLVPKAYQHNNSSEYEPYTQLERVKAPILKHRKICPNSSPANKSTKTG